ncbi:hypothetical protein NBT05_12675 [Aquimarina sp. ERC-38]|uniref:hypothetical protein n=1 Tax=Aquimarina sp. ERC-38 TaxID=2949996 RepID=UPI002247C0BA|nr:hypothetical protein [Aquimarina sp. ERC-38]UZO79803.1 hypothetical protein NBT05_12675 [Aquimarina sp. ERC-38]
MAEIRIEKKRTLWPWLLGALIVAGLIYFIVLLTNTSSNEVSELSEIETISPAPPLVEDLTAAKADIASVPVSDISGEEVITDTSEPLIETEEITLIKERGVAKYVAFTTNQGEMDLDHEYSSQSLLLLIDAVKEVADAKKMDLSVDLNEAKKSAKVITKDPYALNHADHIKKAATLLTKALETVQKKSFISLDNDIALLKNKVEAIQSDEETLDQKLTVKNYFNQAAIVLTKMQL